MKNPFKPAEPVARKLKILLFGPAGSGKTTAALTFPRVAMIDTEGGADLYAGRPGINPFHILRAKTLSDVENAVTFIKEDNGKSFDTLVIDSVTVLYEVTREALARGSKSGEMSYREWGKLNTRMENLYNTLTSLPVHVVMIAREATEYEGTGDNLRKTGTKPDADKSIVYNVDFVVRMTASRAGLIVKSRGQDIAPEGDTLPRITWDVFSPLAQEFSTGATVEYTNKSDAIEAETEPLTDVETARAFVMHWRKEGLTDRQVLTALDVERLSHWTKGRAAADHAVQAWLDVIIEAEKPTPAAPQALAIAQRTAKDETDPFADDADLVPPARSAAAS